MLKSLRLQNVKSWRDSGEIRLAPISGLFGTNSSGKTSILQLLLLLKQTIESSDRAQVLNLGDDRALVDLGTFSDLVYNHDTTASVAWSFEWEPRRPVELLDPEGTRPLFEPDRLLFRASVTDVAARSAGAHLVSERFEYEFGGEAGDPTKRFGMERGHGASQTYNLTASGFELKRSPGRLWGLPAPVKFYGFPDQVFAYYRNAGFLADLQLALEELLTETFYLGPLRDYPRRQYIWAGGHPSDMGRRGERTVDAILASRARGELISRGKGYPRRPLDWVVASWLQSLGLIHSFQVRLISEGSNLYQVFVRRTARAPEVSITDVGFGVSQILPVLTLLYYVPRGSVVILEQPEIHLHPFVQAGLADVLIDAATKHGVQILLESHSEHLLRRLQRRIAEGEIESSSVALYFCEASQAGSLLTPLQIDPYGAISNWPEDFFGDELGEVAETVSAGLRRQMAESGS